MAQISSTVVCLAGQQGARANGLRHASCASWAVFERLKGRRSMIQFSAYKRRPTAPASVSGGSAGGNSGDELPPAASSSGLTTEEAYSYLGLEASASYEDVLAAKNQMLERHHGNAAEKESIEAAYDRILMAQMNARISGSLPVSASVRFADVTPARRERRRQPKSAGGGLGRGLPSLGGVGGLGVSVQPPPAGPAAATAAAAFGGLAAWTLAQGLLEPPQASPAADVPGLQLALGCAASVYLLRQSRRAPLAKALALTLAGLVAGTLVGGAFEGWLRVDLTPVGGLHSPGTVVGLFGLSGLAAAALFLS